MTDEPEQPRIMLAVDALPYTQVDTDNGDQLLRQWVFKEIHGIEVPLTQQTLAYCEAAFNWLKSGQTTAEPKVKVVK